MTDEELNVAICKLRGWRFEPERNGEPRLWPWVDGSGCFFPRIPNHINGIEALGHMHEAEKELLGDCEIEWHKYRDWLYATIEPHRHVINSTAKQRAVALAKTLGIYLP